MPDTYLLLGEPVALLDDAGLVAAYQRLYALLPQWRRAEPWTDEQMTALTELVYDEIEFINNQPPKTLTGAAIKLRVLAAEDHGIQAGDREDDFISLRQVTEFLALDDPLLRSIENIVASPLELPNEIAEPDESETEVAKPHAATPASASAVASPLQVLEEDRRRAEALRQRVEAVVAEYQSPPLPAGDAGLIEAHRRQCALGQHLTEISLEFDVTAEEEEKVLEPLASMEFELWQLVGDQEPETLAGIAVKLRWLHHQEDDPEERNAWVLSTCCELIERQMQIPSAAAVAT